MNKVPICGNTSCYKCKHHFKYVQILGSNYCFELGLDDHSNIEELSFADFIKLMISPSLDKKSKEDMMKTCAEYIKIIEEGE